MIPVAPAFDPPEIRPYLRRWQLVPDGAPFATPSSVLAPVRMASGRPGMLKIATVAEEARGNRVMAWWDGRGAAQVFEHDDTAILLDRARGQRSLSAMAVGADDDAATIILCETVGRLHRESTARMSAQPASAPHAPVPAGLPRLRDWFGALLRPDAPRDAFSAVAVEYAQDLLADQAPPVLLHGDVHHGNVLDFGSDGWLAIDPKGILGDRYFDYLNILCNPNPEVAGRPGRLERQLDLVAETAGLDPHRLLRWTIAWCGLSAAWFEEDGAPADQRRALGAEAERLLGKRGRRRR